MKGSHVFLAAAVALVGSSFATASNFSADQTQAIQKIVHDYLLQNPQVLVEVSQALQQKEMAEVEKKAQVAIAANAKAIFNAALSPVTGNPKGDVTIVEFYDDQCGHCKIMRSALDALQKEDSALRVVYKELPIFGGASDTAARLELAAFKQDANKFPGLHASIMSETNGLTDDRLFALATAAGLNVDKLRLDMKAAEVQQELDSNLKLAQALGIQGTPALIIGDVHGTTFKFIPGQASQDALKEAIQQIRSATKA